MWCNDTEPLRKKNNPIVSFQWLTCLMLLVMNQTMKIREKTWTPVTITEVLTIPATKRKQALNAAEVIIQKNDYIQIEL